MGRKEEPGEALYWCRDGGAPGLRRENGKGGRGMLSLIRSGPHFLLLRGDGEALQGFLVQTFGAVFGFSDPVERSREDQTVLHVEDSGKGDLAVGLCDASPAEILCALSNEKDRSSLREARLLPRWIFLRASGAGSSVLEDIRQELGGVVVPLEALFEWRLSSGTVVGCTSRPLNRPLSLKDLHPDLLVLDMPFDRAYRRLRPRAFELFSQSLGDAAWREVQVQIYDKYELYPDHIRRVELVLDGMEMGFPFGEGWTREAARLLLTVRVYRIRLLTFLDPTVVKELLMGLEYDATGERILDMDLYCGREKIGWGALERAWGDSREDLGRRARERLWKVLPEDTVRELEALELRIREASGLI